MDAPTARDFLIGVTPRRASRHYVAWGSEEDQVAILVRDGVSVGVGLRRFIGRLIIERHGARFESQSAGTMTISGPVRVTRSWLAPFGVRTDVVLGHDSAPGNEEVVLTMSWRSASEVIRALQSAGIQVQIRRKLF